MATIKKKQTRIAKPVSKSKGELNRGQGVVKSNPGFGGGKTSGGGISRTQGKKREALKGIAKAAVRVGTLGYSAMVEDAVKKAKKK